MRKIFILFAFVFSAFVLTSCEDFIKDERKTFETRVITLERSKLPFIVERYKDSGIVVKSIDIDTLVMTYEAPGNTIPTWGYFKTTWFFPNVYESDYYSFLRDDDDFYGTETKEILVEITDISSSGGHCNYRAKWPTDPLKTKNIKEDGNR